MQNQISLLLWCSICCMRNIKGDKLCHGPKRQTKSCIKMGGSKSNSFFKQFDNIENLNGSQSTNLHNVAKS